MFILWGVNKNKRDNQDKETSMDEVQSTIEYKEKLQVGMSYSAPAHTGYRAHPASYTMRTGSLSGGG